MAVRLTRNAAPPRTRILITVFIEASNTVRETDQNCILKSNLIRDNVTANVSPQENPLYQEASDTGIKYKIGN
jgi:hypothetical protein